MLKAKAVHMLSKIFRGVRNHARKYGLRQNMMESGRSNINLLIKCNNTTCIRMQIHIDLDSTKKLRIFSKSKRDSTLDRAATHE